MYCTKSYGQTEAAIDFRAIKNDLVQFYREAKKESNNKLRGTKYSLNDYWDMQIAYAESTSALALDLATLQDVLVKLTDRLVSNSGSIPNTLKSFKTYVKSLQGELQNLIKAGALDSTAQAEVSALYDTAKQSHEKAKPWWQKRVVWITTGSIVGGLVLWSIWKERQ